MVYFRTFDSFMEAAERIYSESPTQTRYSIKFCRDTSQVVLRVADNKTVVCYKMVEKEDLRNMEEMNARFLHLCVEREFNEEDVKQAMQAKHQATMQSNQQQQAAKKKPQQNQAKGKKKR